MELEHTTPSCLCSGKYCSSCKNTKCCSLFSKSARAKDGLLNACKSCHNQKRRADRPNQREKINASKRASHARLKEENNARSRAYHAAHKDILNPQSRARYAAHQTERQAYSRAYHAAHRHTILANMKGYRVANSDARKKADRAYNRLKSHERASYAFQWRLRNKERFTASIKKAKALRSARIHKAGGVFSSRQWIELKQMYNYTCLSCGKKEPEITLTVDHVLPLSKGGNNDISNIQPLCFCCNSIVKRALHIDYRPLWKQEGEKQG